MKPSPAAPAIDWLGREPAFRALGAQVELLVRVERALRAASPRTPLSVVSLEAGQLVVTAPNASMAARLRQVEPTLLAALREAGFAVETIRFRPPRAGPGGARPPLPVKRPIPAGALQRLEELAGSVERSPLKDALARLVARRRRGG